MGLIPGLGKTPWSRARLPIPVFLPGESHGQRSLAGYSPWGHRELDTDEATEQAHMHVKIITSLSLESLSSPTSFLSISGFEEARCREEGNLP